MLFGRLAAQFEHIADNQRFMRCFHLGEIQNSCQKTRRVGIVGIDDEFIFVCFSELRTVVSRLVIFQTGFNLIVAYSQIISDSYCSQHILGIVSAD